MIENSDLSLPPSGLSEDILTRFMEKAQEEVNQQLVSTDTPAGKASFHLVTFHLANEEFGVEIGSVQEIIRATEITPVPGAQEHVQGVINLRGKIIPVIDLRKRFRLQEGGASEQQRIVVVEIGEKRLGMLVDSVSQVMRVPAEAVENIPEEATTIEDDYIQGIGKLNNRLIIMLDLNQSLLATKI
jgi:purine-binding chemotaxis protein CheW